MHSLFVRLRKRALSHHPPGEGQPNPNSNAAIAATATPIITSPPGEDTPVSPQQTTATNTPVARHIIPDINALMDTYSTSSDQEGSQGLRLPRARKRSLLDSIATVVGSAHSAAADPAPTSGDAPDIPTRTRKRSLLDSFATVMGSTRDPEPTQAEADEVQDSLDDDVFTSTMASPGEGSPRLSKYGLPRLAQISSSGTWSTFGRQKKSTAPRMARFTPSSSARHSRIGSIDSSVPPRPSSSFARTRQESVTSVNRYYASPSRMSSVGVPQSLHSTMSRTSSHKLSYDEHAPQSHSPPLTTSSRQNSMTRTSHSSPSSQSHHDSHSSTGIPKAGVESPRTFGNITPPPHRSGIRSSSASPPPLPPLDHPELVATLAARSRTTTRESADQGTSGSHTWSQRNTYPRRRYRNRTTESINDENISPTDTTTLGRSQGRSIRGYSSLPQVRDIFPLTSSSISTPQVEQAARGRASLRRTSSRRSSAEWSAHQATIGVVSDNIHEYGWPAEVSREMLRLSLREPEDIGNGREANAEDIPRGRHVPEPHARVSSTSCFPSLDPLSPPPSHSFTSSTFPEGPLHPRGDTLSTLRAKNPSAGRDHDGESLNQAEARTDFSQGGTAPSESPMGLGLDPRLDGERIMPVQDGEARTRSKSSPPQRMTATLPRASNSARVPRRSILNPPTPIFEAGPSTPERTPNANTTPKHSAMKPRRTSSEPGLLSVLETPTNNKGKRKAEEVEVTPPDQKSGQRATFVIPENGRRPHHESESSHAPSSYQRKRVRLSGTTPTPSPSRPGSSSQNAGNTGSWSNRAQPSPIPGYFNLHRTASRATSTRSNQQSPPTPTSSTHDTNHRRTTAERRSMSELSIPISALIAPHAPSISRSSTYHMRDPRRPAPIRPTSWGLHFKNEDEEGSSVHAWCFFIGFVLFPLWWIASFAPIPQTRHVGGTDTEKAVTLDDPQVEQDARSWRFRCRIMAGISFLTYIPFIVLIAIFVPR